MNMTHNLIIKDELIGTGVSNEFVLFFESAQVTIADIIGERVRHEVENHNKRSADSRFMGLVQPTQSESDLNGYRLNKGRKINASKQVDVALREFESGAYFILVDDLQIQSLDEKVTLCIDTQVTFIKLMPLVGG